MLFNLIFKTFIAFNVPDDVCYLGNTCLKMPLFPEEFEASFGKEKLFNNRGVII